MVNNYIRVAGISIHALVKRATGWDSTDRLSASISIHALVKRATFTEVSKYFVIFDFNPRPREEGDQSALDGGLCLWISIHALVKRAT